MTVSWTELKGVKAYLLSWHASGSQVIKTKTVTAPASSAIIDGLSNGTVYLIKIAAEAQGGAQTAWSKEVLALPSAPSNPAPKPKAPTQPSGLSAAAQDGQVSLTWLDPKDPNLLTYAVSFGVVSDNLSELKTIEAPASSAIIDGLVNGSTYFFAIEATNSSSLKSARSVIVSATPQAVPMAPKITDLKIDVMTESGYADLGLSNQVRQGADIRLRLTGSRLDSLTAARLGGITLTIGFGEDTQVSLSGVIPHGSSPGLQTLILENAIGSFSLADALEITKISSSANALFNPSDSCFDPSQPKFCGLGTPNRPFRTLSKAVSLAGTGDTVLLTAGTYSAGETWPLSSGIPSPNIPVGVSIEGQTSDRNTVILQGPGKTSGYSGLVFAGDGAVKNLSLRGFKYAMILRRGSQTTRLGSLAIDNVESDNNFDGLHVWGAVRLDVTNSAFIGNGDDGVVNGGSGIYVAGSTPFVFQQSNVEGNVYGIYVDWDANGNLMNVTSKDNIRDGIFSNRSQLVISNSTLSGNGFSGLFFAMPAGEYSLFIDKSTITGNKYQGVHLKGIMKNLLVTLFNSSLSGNAQWQLFDERNASTGTTIYSLFTSYEGTVPATGTLTSGNGGYESVINSKKLFRIQNVGNSIEFNAF